MLDTKAQQGQNQACGIGSPASQVVFFSSIWSVERGHLVCARSLTRYYQPRQHSALIGSQANKFKDSTLGRVFE